MHRHATRTHARTLAPLASLAALTLVAAACGGGEPGEEAAPAEEGLATDVPGRTVVADVGFDTPESVLHDPVDDVYLVSNIAGTPLEEDGNGFISRLTPGGEVAELRWIDGTAEGVELNAPKGMAILGDSLYVADIDCVRVFVRTTGAPAASVCFPEATFLNDIAVDENNILYVTDMGMEMGEEGMTPSGTDAVYRFNTTGRRAALLEGESLGGPNGIAFGDRGGFVVTMRSGEIYQIAPDGSRQTVLPSSDRQLDGIVFTTDGGFLFSSWGNQAVYRVRADGQVVPVIENVESPADIGYDAERDRVLVPVFNGDRVIIQELGAAGGTGGAGS